MLTVLCFKWHDPAGRHNHLFVYRPEYVDNLRAMLARHLSLDHELVCVTDDRAGIDPRVRIVDMPPHVKALGALNPKLYAFHPDGALVFGERILLLDLDCVIAGPLAGLLDRPEAFVGWRQPDGAAGRINTSMVLFDGGAWPEIWTGFDPVETPRRMVAAGYTGWEQDWVSWCVGRPAGRSVGAWPRAHAGIESWGAIRRAGLVRPPAGCRIVFFNGRIAPGMASCQAEAPWIRADWHADEGAVA